MLQRRGSCCSVVALVVALVMRALYFKRYIVYSGLPRGAACCSVSQCVAVCCGASQYVATRCSVLQCVAMYCNVMQGSPYYLLLSHQQQHQSIINIPLPLTQKSKFLGQYWHCVGLGGRIFICSALPSRYNTLQPTLLYCLFLFAQITVFSQQIPCKVVMCSALFSRYVVCCSMLQRFTACCSMLQCDSCHATPSGVLFVAACCSMSHCLAVCCSVLQYIAVCCSVLRCLACCSVCKCSVYCSAFCNQQVYRKMQ